MRPLAPLALLLLVAGPALAQAPPPPPKPPAPEQPPRTAAERIEQVLSSRRLTVSFPGTPVGEVADFLIDITGLDVSLDPGVDLEAPVTLRMQDAPLRDVLDAVTRAAGLQARVWCDVLYLVPAGKVLPDPPAPPAEGELGRRLRELTMNLDLPDLPAAEALDFVRELTHLTITVADEAAAAARAGRVSVRARELPLHDALSLLLLPHGLTWRVDGAGISVVLAPEGAATGERASRAPVAPGAHAGLSDAEVQRRLDREVRLRLSAANVHEAAVALSNAIGVPVDVVAGVPKDLPIVLDLDGPGRDALDLLCGVSGRTWSAADGHVVIR